MKYLFTLLASCLVVLATAQSGTISGQITSEDGITLPGAIVRIVDSDFNTISDLNGEYRLTGIPNGNYQVMIEYIGFDTVSKELNLENAATLNFTLTAGVALDQIIIVGQNLQGISRALNQQKNNSNITNVVSADQIGRFPDANIGDAMKRIPGITMQNDQGEARNIFIRGIAPQYNSVTLNGDRIPSAEGDNRNIQMDLIPADMVQLVEVNKAITPEMDADAIGGSVNLVTRTASSEPRISATFAPGFSPIRDKANWTGGLVAGNRFANNKLGVVFSGSYNYKDYGSDNFEAEYDYDGDAMGEDPFISEFQIRRYDVTRQRISGGLDLDYKFNPNHTIRIKGLVSDRKDWENRYRVVYSDMTPDGNAYTIERETKGGTTDIKDRRLEHQKVNKFGVDGDHVFGKIHFDWSGSYSDASEDRPNERYANFVAERDEDDNEDPFLTSVSGFNTENPNVSLATPLSASEFEIDELTEEFQNTIEKNWKAKLNFSLPVMTGENKSQFKFGYAYNNKNKERNNRFKDYKDDVESIFESLAEVATNEMTPDDFNPGEEYALGEFASEEFLSSLNLDPTGGENVFDEFVPVNYVADEIVNAGYLQYNQAIGEKWSFIGGVRFETTSIDYNGNELNQNVDEDDPNFITPTTGKSDYDNWLPSIHANYRPNQNAVLRLAWTNSLARPSYYDLVPYALIDDDEIEVGNPKLVAAESMNFDLMGEYYFEEIGVVSVGGFYKNIDNFFYNFQMDDVEFNGVEYSDFTQPRNGREADVYGFEAGFQRQLDFIGGIFNNINFYGNYTFTDSKAEINEERANEDLTLAGTAPHLVNASLMYEDNRFNTRVSYNYASDYVDEYGDEAFEDIFYDKQSFLDVNANYFLTKQWTIFAEAKNLTNQPLRYYQGEGFVDRTFQMEYYEPTYNVGVKFDF